MDGNMMSLFRRSRRSTALDALQELEGLKVAIETELDHGKYDPMEVRADISALRTYSQELILACDGEPSCEEVRAHAQRLHKASLDYGQRVACSSQDGSQKKDQLAQSTSVPASQQTQEASRSSPPTYSQQR